MTALPTAAAVLTTVVPDGRYCVKCAYALAGLSVEGRCPECGTSIELSLRQNTLALADVDYLRSLRRGLSLVLWGIVLPLLLGIARGAHGLMGLPTLDWMIAIPLVVLSASTLMLFAGYLFLTRPDPGAAALERRHSARAMLRSSTWIQIGAMLGSIALDALEPVLSGGWARAGGLDALPEILGVVFGVAWLFAWFVQFFATLRLVRHLGSRVPDDWVVRRSKRYVWLLPLIFILGLACVWLGPLIALVLYWNLLDRLNKHIKSILRTGVPAPLKNRAPDIGQFGIVAGVPLDRPRGPSAS